MNKIQGALHELSEMDTLAEGTSPIHALHPAAKLTATIAYILVVISFDKYDLAGLTPMVLWPVLIFQASGTEMKTCFYKLRLMLPLVMAVGLFNPFFDKTILLTLGPVPLTGGIVSMVTVMQKGVFCLMASFLLMATTTIDSLCGVLRHLHVPKLLVTLLLLTYRYVGVLAEELAVMTDAYQLRAPGQKGIHISAWGSFLGQLLLRSMDKAQELYASMLLRGYNGHFDYTDTAPFKRRDALYILICCAAFGFLRTVRVAELMGGAMIG